MRFAFERVKRECTERKTEVDVTFHFPVLLFALNKRCQRQTGVSQYCSFSSFVQSFVARLCKTRCAMRNNLNSLYAYHGCDGGSTLRFMQVLG